MRGYRHWRVDYTIRIIYEEKVSGGKSLKNGEGGEELGRRFK